MSKNELLRKLVRRAMMEKAAAGLFSRFLDKVWGITQSNPILNPYSYWGLRLFKKPPKVYHRDPFDNLMAQIKGNGPIDSRLGLARRSKQYR